jgi:predicted nucleic acid-binding Zn ribbon protein
MFRRSVQSLDDVLSKCLRENGLETPMLQTRLIDSWEEIAGKGVARYTSEKFIRNQTLRVKITSPALRSELSMMRTELVNRLNQHVDAPIITDIRFY